MKDIITTILESTGPCLSSTVLRILVDDHKLSPQVARQRLQRRPPNIRSLSLLPFPRNAKFLYFQSDYGSPAFWKALITALEECSPGYSSALAALTERGGIFPKRHFPIASGAPIAQQGHMSAETILHRLIGAKLLEEIDVPGVGVCVSYARGGATFFARQIDDMKARLIVESLMLDAVKKWARNLGLGSFQKFAVRDVGEVPRVGTFAWDLTAPSYLAPLRAKSDTSKPNPGFIACDILLGRTVSKTGIRPFLRKCSTLNSLKKIGRCLHIFVADAYSPAALSAARTAGIMPATPESLFGSEVAEAFLELTKILTDAASAAVDPDKFDWLFKKLGKIEGAALSLRGVLFEFVVCDLVRKLWGTHVTLNHKFREGGVEVAEVDVLAVLSNRRIYFIECKGHAPHQTVGDEEVRKWLTKRIPIVREHALRHPEWKHLEMHFELWTSGKLSGEAVAEVVDAQGRISPNKYVIRYHSGDDINDLAKELNDETLKRVIQKHFLEHPFSSDEFQELPSSPYVPVKSDALPKPDAAMSSSLKPLQIEHAATANEDIAQ